MAPRKSSGMVVAREAIVINVGGRPPKYERVTVTNKRTGEPAVINKDEPEDPGDLGMPYAFKENQKVSRNHPAVKACPGAFLSEDELEDAEVA
jgi:hypothetical protein